MTGVPSGFPSLDRVTYGWQNTDLIILAARPAVGKTAFALNLARNAVMHPGKPTPVALFSLEMSAGQLVQRILAAESEIWQEKIARGKGKTHRPGLYYCAACNGQFTVTVGTVMERSKIPLSKWLLAMHLMGASKKGMSALQIQRLMGFGSYETAHSMCHKIRAALIAPEN